tara:strand:- start:302 stop:514 length:213 start_codon:yes stop_codon:yes gene_type:complete
MKLTKKKLRGGDEKKKALKNTLKKTEGMQKIEEANIEQLIPLMLKMEKQMNEQMKTYQQINSLLGDYFSK